MHIKFIKLFIFFIKNTWGCSINNGYFITLCGGEGTGKSTQAKKIYEYLTCRGIPCVLTKEPGGTETGTEIRKILLSPESSNLDPKAELFLYLADRAQHFRELIVPAIEKGKIIICDRFIDSTYVYQGEGRCVDPVFIDSMHGFILGDFLPDLTIVLDIDPEEGMKRIGRDMDSGVRSVEESRFDSEELSFHEKIRKGFLNLVRNDTSGRFFIVDALLDKEDIFDKIIEKFKEKGFITI